MSNATQNRKNLPVWLALLLILGTGILVYAQVHNFEFIYFDDDEYIFHNQHVVTGLTAENLTWAFTTTLSKHWHPLTWLSHMLDAELFGLNPAGHHLMNLGLHLLTAMLLFWFLERTTSEPGLALLVALGFTLHPLHVENVAWVANRKDLLCALFWMITLNAYAWYVKNPGLRRYLAALLAFSLATLTKSMAVTLPLVLLLLDVWPLKRSVGLQHCDPDTDKRIHQSTIVRLFVEKAPFLAVSLVIGLVTLHAIQARQYHTPIPLAAGASLALGMKAYLAYLAKLFYPVDLITPYPLVIPGDLWLTFLLHGAFILVITTVAIRFHRCHPYVMVGWGWYLLTLLPVAGFLGPPRLANRYAYIPLIGIYILLAWGTRAGCRRWPCLKLPLLVMVIALTGLWAGITLQQTGTWRNTLTLFQHTLEINPQSSVANVNVGAYMFSLNHVDAAIQYQQKAVELAPYKPEYRYNLGVSYLKKKDYAAALSLFNKATQMRSDYIPAMSNRGLCLLHLGKLQTARREFEKVLALQPDHTRTHNRLGHYYVLQGDLAAAENQFRQAISMDPEYGDALANLAGALAAGGAHSKGEHYYLEAIRVAPENSAYYFGLANLLAYQNKFEEAAKARHQGLGLDPDSAEQHYFMAVDNYFTGDLRLARQYLKQAKKLGYQKVEKLFEEKLAAPPPPDQKPEGTN